MSTAGLAFLCMQKKKGYTPDSSSDDNLKHYGFSYLSWMWNTNHGLMNFHYPIFFSSIYSNHRLALGFSVVLLLIYSVLKSCSSTRWQGACLILT